MSIISAEYVPVFVGLGSAISPLGRNEAHVASMQGSPDAIGFMAVDAKLVAVDSANSNGRPVFRRLDGGQISVGEIESDYGAILRAQSRSRHLPAKRLVDGIMTDIAAPLPHRFEEGSEEGGLREILGLRKADFSVSGNPFQAMKNLYKDSVKEGGPSRQQQIAMGVVMESLAALPKALRDTVKAYHFKTVWGACFGGEDSDDALTEQLITEAEDPTGKNRYNIQESAVYYQLEQASRLARKISSNAPAECLTFLSPGAKSMSALKKSAVAEAAALSLQGDDMWNIPYSPFVVNAACASALTAFCSGVDYLFPNRGRDSRAKIMLLGSADAAIGVRGRNVVGFGEAAVKDLKGRCIDQALGAWDQDASGTIVGEGGYAVLVTSLKFAIENKLDILGLCTGYSECLENGLKAVMSGIGFGGHQALYQALRMSYEDHGFGLEDFDHLEAHATGTALNAMTEPRAVSTARRRFAEFVKFSGSLPQMTVGASKAVMGAHLMGPAGAISLQKGLLHILGRSTWGIPGFKKHHPEVGPEIEEYKLSGELLQGRGDGGVLIPVQGFGGYNAGLAIKAATPDIIARYPGIDPMALAEYLEQWDDIRAQREVRERVATRTPRNILNLADQHRWLPNG